MKDARQSLRLVRPKLSAQGKLPPPAPPSLYATFEKFRKDGLPTVLKEHHAETEAWHKKLTAWFQTQQQAEEPTTTASVTEPILNQVDDRSTGTTVSDATIQNIITTAVNQVTQGVPGVAALRRVTPHPNNAFRYLAYLNTPGDGMGRAYVYNHSETTADDGVDYVKPADVTGAGRWVRSANA